MQVVKQTKFGNVESVRYNLYLNSTEFNDLRNLLTSVSVPYSDVHLDNIRKYFIESFFNEITLCRLKSLTSQFCLEL